MDGNTGVRKKKGGRIPVLILLVIVVGLAVSAIYAFSNADKLGATPRGAVSKDMGITLEQADDVLAVFEQCGIADYKTAVHDDMLDDWDYEGQTGYRVEANGQKNIIVYLDSDGRVDLINWIDITFYQDGTALGKITDYIVS